MCGFACEREQVLQTLLYVVSEVDGCYSSHGDDELGLHIVQDEHVLRSVPSRSERLEGSLSIQEYLFLCSFRPS